MNRLGHSICDTIFASALCPLFVAPCNSLLSLNNDFPFSSHHKPSVAASRNVVPLCAHNDKPIWVTHKPKRQKQVHNIFYDDRGFPDQSDEFNYLLHNVDGSHTSQIVISRTWSSWPGGLAVPFTVQPSRAWDSNAWRPRFVSPSRGCPRASV